MIRWIELQSKAMGERDAAMLRRTSPLLRRIDAAVPALPAPQPVPEHPEVHEAEHQEKQSQEPWPHKTTHVPEPPPIMLQHAGTENSFQPAEVLSLEPRDETPISGQPLARKPRIQLGFASRQDENGVAQDKGLMGWIDEQRARHKR